MTDYIQVRREDVERLKAFMEKPIPNTENALPLYETYKRLSAALSAEPVGMEWQWEEQGGKTNEWRVYLGPHCFGGVWGWKGTYGAEVYLLHPLPNDEKYSGSLDSAKAKLTSHLEKILSACGLYRLSPLTVSGEPVGQFNTSDYIIVGSDGKPRRNEPVGVTVDRDALRFAVDFINRNQTQKEDAIFLARLAASITGEKG